MVHNKRKVIISLFVSLNIITVLFMNRPLQFVEAANKTIQVFNSEELTGELNYCSNLIKMYAHIFGLDNRWQMFGRQSRFNWWYLISGKYADSSVVTLPVPFQAKRTLWESLFVDFKEGKFDLNLYNDPGGREIYSRYLCRKYASRNASPIQSIIFDLYFQHILPPEEADQVGFYMHPGIYSQPLNEFQCPKK